MNISTINNYFGREQDFINLISNIDNFRVFFISGTKGIGKSSFGQKLFDFFLNEKKLILIWFDCCDYKSLDEILTELKKKYNLKSKINEKNFYTELDELNIYIFIDNIHLYDYKEVSTVTEQFLLNLNKSRVFVFSRLNIVLKPVLLSEIYFLKLSRLSLFYGKEYIKFLLKTHSYTKFTNSDIELFYKITAGSPYLIKYLVGAFLLTGQTLHKFLLSSPEKFIQEELIGTNFENLSASEKETLLILSILNFPIEITVLSEFMKFDITDIYLCLKKTFLIDIDNNSSIFMYSIFKDIIKQFFKTSELTKKSKALGLFLEGHFDKSDYIYEAFYQFIIAGEFEKAIDIALRISDEITSMKKNSQIAIKCFEKAWELQKDYKFQELLKSKIQIDIFYNRADQKTIELINKLDSTNQNQTFKASVFKSLNMFDKACEIFLNLYENKIKKVTSLYNLIQCYIELGKIKEAEKFCVEGFQIADKANTSEELHEKYRQSIIKINGEYKDSDEKSYKDSILLTYGMFSQLTGYIFTRQRKLQDSCEMFDAAILKYNKAENYFNLPGTYYAKAYSLLLLHNYKESIFNYIKCVKYFKKRNYPALTERRAEYIIEFHFLKKSDKAQSYLKYYFDYFLKNNKSLNGKYYELEGKIYFYNGEIKKAANSFLSAAKIYKNENHINHVYSSLLHLNICNKLLNKKMVDSNKIKNFFIENSYYSELGVQYYIEENINSLNKIIKNMDLSQLKIYQKQIELYEEVKKRLSDFDKTKVINDSELKFCELKALDSYRKNCLKYEIFIDFLKKECYVSGNKVNFFGKSLFEKIILTFLESPDYSIDIDTLYSNVWNDSPADLNKVRVNLTGIKKLLGNIFHYNRESKKYSIKKGLNMCIILK